MGKITNLYTRCLCELREALGKMGIADFPWCLCPQMQPVSEDEESGNDECKIKTKGVVNGHTLLSGIQNGFPSNNMSDMDPNELNKQFSIIINDFDLSETNKTSLLNLPMDKKWQIYINSQSHRGHSNPQYYIDAIRHHNCPPGVWDSLSTSLRTERKTFVEQFLTGGGLDSLLECLKKTGPSLEPKLERIPCSASCVNNNSCGLIRAIRSLMNSSVGRAHVLAHNEFINSLALMLLFSPNKLAFGGRNAVYGNEDFVKSQVYEILGALCLIPNGHVKVLRAVSQIQKVTAHRARFQIVMIDLENMDGGLRLKRSILSFINALINYGEGEESLEFRLHLRYEFLVLDIESVLERLAKLNNASLDKHIQFFHIIREKDERKFYEKLNKPNAEHKYLDASKLHSELQCRLAHSANLIHFENILYHLLMLSSKSQDTSRWLLIQRLVQEAIVNETKEFSESMIEKTLMSLEAELELRSELTETKEKLICSESDVKSRSHTIQSLHTEISKLKDKLNRAEQGLTDLSSTSNAVVPPPRSHKSNKSPRKDSNNKASCPNNGTISPIRSPSSPPEGVSPPPPPPPPMNNGMSSCGPVPPPPPPPPPPMGMGGGPPPPPPPPPLSGGKKCTPVIAPPNVPASSKPLKSLNWTKIPESKLGDTLWAQLEPDKFYDKLDLEELEKYFGAESSTLSIGSGIYGTLGGKRSNSNGGNGSSNGGNVSGTSGHQYNNIIESRRAQNLTILLSKLKLGDEEIIDCVTGKGDPNLLPLDMIEQLGRFVPTQDEIRRLKEVHSAEDLPRADAFLYKVARISHWSALLFILEYKRRFNEQRFELSRKIELLMKGSDEILKSEKVGELLSVILAVGNYMNNKGHRGNAVAFSLHTLLRIQDTKSNNFASANTTNKNHKFNLLHFLAEQIQAKWPHLLLLQEELTHSSQAKKINLQELDKDVQNLSHGLQRVVQELEYQEKENIRLQFIQSTKEFVGSTTVHIQQLNRKLNVMKIQFKKVTSMFGEEFDNPEEFFNIFDYFLSSLSEAVNENEKRKAAAVAAATTHHHHVSKTSSNGGSISTHAQGARSSSGNVKSQEPNPNNGNEFDELITALSNGDVFGDLKVTKRRGTLQNQKTKQISGSATSSLQRERIHTK